MEYRSLYRARRILGPTLTAAVLIALAVPVGARSAQPGEERTARLLEAVEAPSQVVNRGALATRSGGLIRGDALSAPVGYENLEPRAPGPALVTVTAQIRTIPRAPFVVDGSVWDRLAQCESSGNWSINTGNGYYGGLQFSYSTWLSYGGGEYAEYAHLATREQQIEIAERLYAKRGFQPWPGCRAKLGLP